ncbi:MAG: hypothetical protein ABIG20_03140 [archaeon]
MKLKTFAIVLILVILMSGCISAKEKIPAPVEDAKQFCITACIRSMADGTLTEAGPCLNQEIAEDWVCDIAHSPRQAVDDLAENQCESFINGETHHFVEVTTSCAFIRAE